MSTVFMNVAIDMSMMLFDCHLWPGRVPSTRASIPTQQLDGSLRRQGHPDYRHRGKDVALFACAEP